MQKIDWGTFEAVELRVGKVIQVEDFPEAHQPAYKIVCDFGDEIGIKRTSARVTALYTKEQLLGKYIIGVVNFPVKQIGPIRSEFLLTGFANASGEIVLAQPEREVPIGAKLC